MGDVQDGGQVKSSPYICLTIGIINTQPPQHISLKSYKTPVITHKPIIAAQKTALLSWSLTNPESCTRTGPPLKSEGSEADCAAPSVI